MNLKRIKLSEFAKQQGIAYISAYKMWSKGQIEGIQLPSGTILVSGWQAKHSVTTPRAIIYNRISPNKTSNDDGKETLQNLEQHALKQKYEVVGTLQEIAYSFSSNKPVLKDILSRTDWDILLVCSEHIITSIGYEEFSLALSLADKKIETADEAYQFDGAIIEKLLNNVSNLLKGIIGMPSYKKPIQENIKKLID